MSNGGPLEQFAYLNSDVCEMMNRRRYRWLTCWLRDQFWAVATYRLERAVYLASGGWWPLVRLLTRPFFAVIRPGPVDIRCEADIGPGFLILHPSLGVVVSYHTVAGRNLILTGGNCIGVRERFDKDTDRLELGDDVSLGANAVVLGPVLVGHRTVVGAAAVVSRDVPEGATVRMPAAQIQHD